MRQFILFSSVVGEWKHVSSSEGKLVLICSYADYVPKKKAVIYGLIL